MPNLDFFATLVNLEQVFGVVREMAEVRAFELDSAPDQQIRQFDSWADIATSYWRPDAGAFDLRLVLHGPAFGGALRFERIELHPTALPPHTHRYVVGGWGSLIFTLGSTRGCVLGASSLSQNSRARAEKWGPVRHELGDVADWDWPFIEKLWRRLERMVRGKLSAGRHDRLPILRDAHRLVAQGALRLP